MKKLISGILAVPLILFSTTGFAQTEVEALRETVEKLTKRVNQLEGKVEVRSTNVVPAGAPQGNFIEGAMSGVRLTGYVETGYHQNFQNPAFVTPTGTAVDRTQSVAVFDTVADSFTLHAVKIALDKAAPTTGGVGFRTDLIIGQDAKVIDSAATTGANPDEFSILQGYVEARLPLHALEGNNVFGDSLYFRAGKYTTLAGAEVVEGKDNWNVTRSFMFGYAIPIAHTGARMAYDLWDGKVTLTTGLNNGWDLMEDNNRYKTWEGQIAFKPSDKFLFTTTAYVGPENLNQIGHKRGVVDFVALWKATDKLSLMANVDYGTEGRAVGAGERADWSGYALYARYQATDKLAFATRGEIFMDHNSFRVGPGAIVGGAAIPREERYTAWTATTEYKLYENLITRLEYRYDWAETALFEGESSQSTVSAQLIYNFA